MGWHLFAIYGFFHAGKRTDKGKGWSVLIFFFAVSFTSNDCFYIAFLLARLFVWDILFCARCCCRQNVLYVDMVSFLLLHHFLFFDSFLVCHSGRAVWLPGVEFGVSQYPVVPPPHIPYTVCVLISNTERVRFWPVFFRFEFLICFFSALCMMRG